MALNQSYEKTRFEKSSDHHNCLKEMRKRGSVINLFESQKIILSS